MRFRQCLLLAISLLLLTTTSVRGAKDADADRVGQLVRQLGSKNFAERKAATLALERIGLPALPALRDAARNNKDAEVCKRAADLVVQIENGLDQLLADYRSYGLPLPPDNAPLVKFKVSSGGTTVTGDGDGRTITMTNPPVYALGFLLQPADWFKTHRHIDRPEVYPTYVTSKNETRDNVG